jgi:hypothetical protein
MRMAVEVEMATTDEERDDGNGGALERDPFVDIARMRETERQRSGGMARRRTDVGVRAAGCCGGGGLMTRRRREWRKKKEAVRLVSAHETLPTE